MEYGNDISNEVIDKPTGPSQTSCGSGFFGETALLNSGNNEPLPDDAMDTVQSINDYLEGIILDENIMNMLTVTQRNSMKSQHAKLLKDLNDQIPNNRMSHYAFSYLMEIFNSLQSKQYDQAQKHITDFTKSCRSKKIKFATHRKWVMAFGAIIRIAKSYNI